MRKLVQPRQAFRSSPVAFPFLPGCEARKCATGVGDVLAEGLDLSHLGRRDREVAILLNEARRLIAEGLDGAFVPSVCHVAARIVEMA